MSIATDAVVPTKIAIVTGGSRGIGRSTDESLARGGVHTIFTYHTRSEDAEAVVAVAKDAGPEAFVVAPGATETDFSGGIVRDNPAVNKRVAEGTALGRAGLPRTLGG